MIWAGAEPANKNVARVMAIVNTIVNLGDFNFNLEAF
jgi:hypothetical protein